MIDKDGNLLIADRKNRQLRKVILPPQPAIGLAFGRVLGPPGDTLRIPLTLTNTSELAVGGIQFNVQLSDTSDARFAVLEDTTSHAGFNVVTNIVNGTRVVLIHSIIVAIIVPGSNIPLATLIF
ncbi:MAG TPA: hypothetical protein DIT99_09430 [Candidatus Latescibacteria bacterium]|nr:hypothetical protein [Candidatus Latescibacterota bacterium]